ncbi:haloacid dehalogenase type II [Marinobacterium arenosum]|uniref:haloacid dehalogenase type II n=1 Tax=Marinobacterium arenosum TaxID=2862496 RepID=UPI001C93F875|nr:haloacid dehalogenase type II [Marinobacterium arenosum]MBY4677137.1 haloacid dehalogenase type II [Marinobacterium arenosum]
MPCAIGFDVYGTLVDPVAVAYKLGDLIGDEAEAFGRLWHDKKVEYAFRRALMGRYEDFGTCTHDALRYCLQVYNLELSDQQQQALLTEFLTLDAFNDVIPGLQALKAQGHTLVAFSNGPERSVRPLLEQAGVLPLLSDIVSVDDKRTYKPNPVVYDYLVERTGSRKEDCWLVSSNPWDVIGGKSAGLNAAWIKRSDKTLFDPWGIEPDLVVADLVELGKAL